MVSASELTVNALYRLFQSLPGNSKMVSKRTDYGIDYSKPFQSLPGNSKMVRIQSKKFNSHKIYVSIPSREFKMVSEKGDGLARCAASRFQSLPGNSKMVSDQTIDQTNDQTIVSIPSREF